MSQNSQVNDRLLMQAQSELTHEFVIDNTPQYVDNKCGRVSYYSARKALTLNPNALIKNAIDFDSSIVARLVYNLKKIGVQFEIEKPFRFKVAYGHINLKIDAIASSGFPDFPQQKVIMLFNVVSGKDFISYSNSQSVPEWMVNNAQLLMAYGGIKKAALFIVNRASGQSFAQVVDIDFNAATRIDDLSKSSVSEYSIPERIASVEDITASNEKALKCLSCPYVSQCALPESTMPNCYSCAFYSMRPDGKAVCVAKNNMPLDDRTRLNYENCDRHIYNPEMIDSWSAFMGEAVRQVIGQHDIVESRTGSIFANKLTGVEFENVMPIEKKDLNQYTSYEIYGAKGKDLIGDSSISKLKKTFGAEIQGIHNDVSGSNFPD